VEIFSWLECMFNPWGVSNREYLHLLLRLQFLVLRTVLEIFIIYGLPMALYISSFGNIQLVLPILVDHSISLGGL
jgi:hypothetical protein